MRLVWIIYVRNLFRGVIAAWYELLMSRHGLVVAFTGLHGFLNWGVFHHPVWFVCLVGCFLSPNFAWSARPPWGACITEGFGDICRSSPPPPARVLGVYLLNPADWGGFIHQEFSRVSLTPRFRPPWFGKSVFCHTLCSTSTWGTAWPSPGARWNWQAWYSIRMVSFQLSDQRRRSSVLSNSLPSPLWRTSVAIPVVAQRRLTRKDKVLVLVMKIHHTSYLMFLTCCVVFW